MEDISFAGKTDLNLDERGRIGVPTRYRDELGPERKVWVTIAPHPSEKRLLIYSVPAWKEVAARLLREDNSNGYVRHARRRMIGHAAEVELDCNWRVLIPQVLRDYAGLKKKVVLTGIGGYFELWAEPAWNEAMAEGDLEHADAKLGFSY